MPMLSFWLEPIPYFSSRFRTIFTLPLSWLFSESTQCYGATGTMSHRHIIPSATLCFHIEEENVPFRRALW